MSGLKTVANQVNINSCQIMYALSHFAAPRAAPYQGLRELKRAIIVDFSCGLSKGWP